MGDNDQLDNSTETPRGSLSPPTARLQGSARSTCRVPLTVVPDVSLLWRWRRSPWRSLQSVTGSGSVLTVPGRKRQPPQWAYPVQRGGCLLSHGWWGLRAGQ